MVVVAANLESARGFHNAHRSRLPEGTKGIVKPYSERYQLRPFNVGFVEIALELEVPIVPFAVIGAEEQAPILFQIPRPTENHCFRFETGLTVSSGGLGPALCSRVLAKPEC